MGCRAAVSLARQLSDNEPEKMAQGVICLSFPMHPPGQTHAHWQRSEDLRALPEHLAVLFVSGTEDHMCDRVRGFASSLMQFRRFFFVTMYIDRTRDFVQFD